MLMLHISRFPVTGVLDSSVLGVVCWSLCIVVLILGKCPLLRGGLGVCI